MTAQPDIEIYIKNLSAIQLLDWLKTYFTLSDEQAIASIDMSVARSHTTQIHFKDQDIELAITPAAAGKAYASIWFKSDKTPWSSDLECAESALEAIDTEVRCSAESWAEEEPEFSEKWWKLTRLNRELVVWG
jgi:hypothetical protein